MAPHPRARLGPEVLHNHFLDMAMARVQIADRDQRLDPFHARLADPDQQPRGERHPRGPAASIAASRRAGSLSGEP